ncbi:MAG: class I SAM-dependent methyltransferase [Terriglobia bacterium]
MDQRLFGSSASVIGTTIQDWEEITCPLCGIPPRPFARDYQGFQLCRCPACHLEFLSPRPTFEELSDHVYNQTYFSEPAPAAPLTREQLYQFSRQIDTAYPLLGADNKERRTLLDVGCGDGSFLRYGKECGWTVAGCDIGLTRTAREVGCPVWEGQSRGIDFGGLRFDLVRYNHVLEHTQNPLAEIQRSWELLYPGGILYVSVPNLAAVSARIKTLQSLLHLKRHRWRHYAAVHHLWFFTPPTLQRLLEYSGFRVVFWETPVLKKAQQNSSLETAYRFLLERSAAAGIIDFYCTPVERPISASQQAGPKPLR